MKFEPWVSINLLFICLSIGFLCLRNESNTRSMINAAEVSKYLKIRHHLSQIHSIISLDSLESTNYKKLQIIDTSGRKHLLKIDSAGTSTNLLLNEKIICSNLNWAKITVDDDTKVPSIILQVVANKLPVIISLNKKLIRQTNG
tara:strand:+ start:19469 stop:19900 length:432 start_codon:yes stop_codon:yes gene_type:complete